MTHLTRSLLLSLIAAGVAGLAIGTAGPAAAADREAVAVLVAPPVVSDPTSGVEAALATPASAVTPAASATRPAVGHRAPTLNHQRPLNDDLARFTRAF